MEHTDTLVALSDGMADAVENIAASVVKVNGRRRRSGSGVVIAQNKVLTASHVLEREEDLSVETADGRTLTARFAGRDHSTDLAVLDVEDLDVEPATLAVRDRGPPLGWLAPSEALSAPGEDRGWNVTSRPTRRRTPGSREVPSSTYGGTYWASWSRAGDAARPSPYLPTWPGVRRVCSPSGALSSADTSAS